MGVALCLPLLDLPLTQGLFLTAALVNDVGAAVTIIVMIPITLIELVFIIY